MEFEGSRSWKPNQQEVADAHNMSNSNNRSARDRIQQQEERSGSNVPTSATSVEETSNSQQERPKKAKKEPKKYPNAVGGRSLMLSRRDGRILKQARDREIFFYQLIDRALKDKGHAQHTVALEFKRFLPKYYGEEVFAAPEPEEEKTSTAGSSGSCVTGASIASGPGGVSPVGAEGEVKKTTTKKKDEGFLVLESPKMHNPSPASFGCGSGTNSGQLPQQFHQLQQFPATPPHFSADASLADASDMESKSTNPPPPAAVAVAPSISIGTATPPPAADVLVGAEAGGSTTNVTGTTTAEKEMLRMLILEDVCHKFQRPCVMDLKMGDRQYGLGAKEKKIDSKNRKARESTSAELGVRAAGYRRVNPQNDEEVNADKYVCRAYQVPEFLGCMQTFLLDSPELMDAMARQVDDLKELFEQRQNMFRLYTTSLLLLYDYANPAQTARIVMVDFAFTYTMEEMREAQDPAAFTDSDESYCLGLNSLSQLLKDHRGSTMSESKPKSSATNTLGSTGSSPSSSSVNALRSSGSSPSNRHRSSTPQTGSVEV